ncbi:helix-turn-helix domain-containing protein [Stenotrophomonas sp. 24(2023)]|uniref:winged helix-turn-helix transcriptional regulator n=1 Tax=Stenotrophomonas sp. 24(2023) TaxID=3068324 RepID=UPI0027DF42A1|nr:helix-turn-helix domain-containing protein [Stenotrophomonas sp. 24(2023)]WMJ68392.1 helix-turn-helix domain-containing protein [Stenotrophomonas sp. 24(2023)]
MSSRRFVCGLDVVLAVLGGKWKLLALYHLAHGTHRYAQLRRAIGGVSDKVLIQQLKEMQADGLVDRTDHHEVPPRVDYALTPFGRSLAESFGPLCEWGTRHEAEVERVVARRQVATAGLPDAITAPGTRAAR